jgi:hypothetical protein
MPSRHHSPSSEFAAAELMQGVGVLLRRVRSRGAFALDAMPHIVAGAMNQAFLGPQAHE